MALFDSRPPALCAGCRRQRFSREYADRATQVSRLRLAVEYLAGALAWQPSEHGARFELTQPLIDQLISAAERLYADQDAAGLAYVPGFAGADCGAGP